MKDFRQLSVWQKSHELTLAIYELTRSFPREEIYGLTAQIRRVCSSIPAILPKVAARTGMQNSHVTAALPGVQPANWNTT
jgi:four helix bundle protein